MAEQAGHVDRAGGHERDDQYRVHRGLQNRQVRSLDNLERDSGPESQPLFSPGFIICLRTAAAILEHRSRYVRRRASGLILPFASRFATLPCRFPAMSAMPARSAAAGCAGDFAWRSRLPQKPPLCFDVVGTDVLGRQQSAAGVAGLIDDELPARQRRPSRRLSFAAFLAA